jgi:hypothetical protein
MRRPLAEQYVGMLSEHDRERGFPNWCRLFTKSTGTMRHPHLPAGLTVRWNDPWGFRHLLCTPFPSRRRNTSSGRPREPDGAARGHRQGKCRCQIAHRRSRLSRSSALGTPAAIVSLINSIVSSKRKPRQWRGRHPPRLGPWWALGSRYGSPHPQ